MPSTTVKAAYVPSATHTCCFASAAARERPWAIEAHGAAGVPHVASSAPSSSTSTIGAKSKVTSIGTVTGAEFAPSSSVTMRRAL